MKKIVFVNDNVVLVKGKKRGALYDLVSGKIYSLNDKAVYLLEGIIDGYSSAQLSKYLRISENAINKYLNLLKKEVGFDNISERKISIKYRDCLEFVWLEITSKCNLKCKHCYLGDEAGNKRTITLKKWHDIIDQIKSLGCISLQFIGGEPFLCSGLLLDLLKYSHEKKFTFLEVFTNGTYIKDEWLDVCKDLKVNIAVSLYSSNPSIHDKITNLPGSLEMTIKNIKKIIKKEIPLRVGIVEMQENKDDIDNTVQFLKNLGVTQIKIDKIRPTGRALLTSECYNYCIDISKFPKCTSKNFIKRLIGHNCFLNKICISFDGSVYPCIMMRQISYGNILDNDLKDIFFAEKTKEIRYLSKDRINICKDCEYRYGCFDCRVIATSGDINNLFNKPSICIYDPIMGKIK